MSLGVDLIQHKTCTFDCLYCEVGKTTSKVIELNSFVSARDILSQLEKKLEKCAPDAITLAGSGEPTLNSQIDVVISGIKSLTGTRVALLTNGSLFWMPEVRKRVLMADVIMPTLTTGFDTTFRLIHRPHPQLEINMIIDGLKKLRREYSGEIFLEMIFLAGMNDTEEEIRVLKTVVDQLSPEKIQINTVVRPPVDIRARRLEPERLEELKLFFGKQAEIIAENLAEVKKWTDAGPSGEILEMIKRRPLRLTDMSKALSLSVEEIEEIVKALLIKGYIVEKNYSNEIYYLGKK
jgi:wyosine [tRNA(Phe)-imidazoG37] synthetase (radical SAM superfamily)